MSRKKKNFHYHYAEQYETREMRHARSRDRRRFAVPPLALVFSIVLLVLFGLISTTFSVYVTTSFDDPEMPEQGGLVVNVKNSAARADSELQSTGIVRENEDLADSGAELDLAESGTTWHGDWQNSQTTATIYFDNSICQWTNVGFKIGRNWNYGNDPQGYSIYSMTKVTGTDYIYKCTIDWNHYNDFYFVNSSSSGWTENSSVRNHDSKYTAFTTPMNFALGSSTYFFIGQSSSTGSTSSPTEITCFGASGGSGATTASDYTTYQKSVSVANVANGTVTATYKNDSGTNQTINEGGSATILIGKTITVSESASSGYSASDITVTCANNSASVTISSGESVFTTGSGATTITGSFVVYSPPAATSVSLSKNQSTIYAGITSVTFTATPTGAESGVTYNFKVDGTSVQNTSARTYSRTFDTAGTYSVTVTVEKTGYSSVSSSALSTTVIAPSVTFGSLSVEEYKTETLSIASRTPTPSSYSWSVDSSYSSLISLSDQTATSVKVTAAAYSAATAKVKYTATYSNGYSKIYEADVTITESSLKIKGSFDSWTEHKMTYDAAASSTYNRSNLYSYTYTINTGNTYAFVFDEGGNTIYKNGGTITSDRTNCAVENSSDTGIQLAFNTGSDCQITTTAKGSYTFYYDPSTHKCWISEYPGVEYYLLGFGNTTEDSTTQMTKSASNANIYTFTKTFSAAQTYNYNTTNGFKVSCNDGKSFGRSSSTTISRTLTSTTLAESGNYVGFKSSYSGDYTFTYNISTKALTVTFPTRSITVNAKLNTSNTILGSISNTSTSSSFFTITDNYNDTFTVTPTDHTQYQFTKWRDNNSTTGSRTITVSSPTAVTYDTNWNYKSYTITYNTNGGTLDSSCYDTVTTANSVYKSSYTYGTGKTLPTASYITHSSGYTFAGWYESSSFSGSPVTSISSSATGNKTYYAKWVVEVTFRDNIEGNQIGSVQTVAVNGTVTAPTVTGTSVYNDLVDRGYVFTNTWSASLSNITTTQTIYAIFKPNVQNFSISIIPDDRVTGGGDTENDPYVVGFGAAIKVEAEIIDPVVDNDKIHYKWCLTSNGTYVDGIDGTTYQNDDITTMATKPVGTFTLYAMAYATDVNNQDIWNTTIASTTVYYEIESPITGVTVNPVQKIYSTAPSMTLNLDAELYTFKEDELDPDVVDNTRVTAFTTNFMTDVLYFDKSTNSYVTLDDDNAITGSTPNFVSTFNASVFESLNGVNYFRFDLYNHTGSTPTLDSSSEDVRTVVGSSQGSASRPLYVSTTAANSFVGQGLQRRVMLLYITDRGTLGYQTSTSFEHDASVDKEVYRFDIPSYVDGVYITVFDASEHYVLPKYEGGSIIYSESESGETVFDSHCVAHSNEIPISSSTQTLRVSGISGGVISASDALLS